MSRFAPADYIEDITPELRNHPTDWIVPNPVGQACLADFDGDPGDPLKDGEIVQFMEFTDHGRTTLTLTAEGYSVSAPMPAGATHCLEQDHEALSDSVEEVVASLRASGATPGDYELHYYEWSGEQPFRFDAVSRSFLPVGTLQ